MQRHAQEALAEDLSVSGKTISWAKIDPTSGTDLEPACTACIGFRREEEASREKKKEAQSPASQDIV